MIRREPSRLEVFYWLWAVPVGLTLSGAVLLRLAAWVFPFLLSVALILGAAGLVLGGLGLALLCCSIFGD